MKHIIWLCFALFFFTLGCTPEKMEPVFETKAIFSLDKDVAKVGEPILFTNQSEHADSYEWNFGDGHFSPETHPEHIYQTPGTFTIELLAIGEHGSDTETRSIVIEPIDFPPPGSYSGETEEGGTISFTISGEEVTNFKGSYFIGSGGSVFEVNVNMPTYGTMVQTSEGFEVVSAWGKLLTGSFENNTITGTWQHDLATTNYMVEKN